MEVEIGVEILLLLVSNIWWVGGICRNCSLEHLFGIEKKKNMVDFNDLKPVFSFIGF